MFSYYGSKAKIVHHYPSPKFDTIVEPFAGTAQYAFKYFDRDVTLIDKYEIIICIWKWLQKCSPGDILGLPRLRHGESVDMYKFDTIEAKWFMGMIITGGPTQPKKTASRWKTVIRPNTQEYKINFAANNVGIFALAIIGMLKTLRQLGSLILPINQGGNTMSILKLIMPTLLLGHKIGMDR